MVHLIHDSPPRDKLSVPRIWQTKLFFGESWKFGFLKRLGQPHATFHGITSFRVLLAGVVGNRNDRKVAI